jgi:glucose/arabinose dehydrogenase
VRIIPVWGAFLALMLASLRPAEAGEIAMPPGFRIAVFAGGLGGARGLALDPEGVLMVSLPAAGRVVALSDRRGTGRATEMATVLEGLDRPHGLAFRRGQLYVAETGRVVRYRYDAAKRAAGEPAVVVSGLPHGGHHWTRTIAFGPDDRLYVAIGSSCDVCRERDPRRAAIVRYDPRGAAEELFARGLRNPVGLAFHPATGALWTTINERDWPDGGAPPDYVTAVIRGAHYGWPDCFAERRAFLPDPTLPNPGGCSAMRLPSIELVPHSAPLGLAFYTASQFPAEYRGNLFVALHGSRAGLPPAGYGIARIRFRDGEVAGMERFGGPWRQGDRVIGRPVDLAVGRDGSLFISDDHADRVYRVTFSRR